MRTEDWMTVQQKAGEEVAAPAERGTLLRAVRNQSARLVLKSAGLPPHAPRHPLSARGFRASSRQ
jgi:hypothetical protein